MYSNFFNNLKKSYDSLKDSARSLRTRSTAVSPNSNNSARYQNENFSQKAPNIEEEIKEEQVEGVEAAKKKRKEKAKKTSGSEKNIDVDLPHSIADEILLKIFNNRKYGNWIKVGLALRVVCEYIRPVIKDVAEKIHKDQLSRRGDDKILPAMIYACRNEHSDGGQVLQNWLEDIKNLYRKDEKRPHPTPQEVFTMCRATEWPTDEGVWEFSRAFMTKGYRCGGYKSNVKGFDLFSLLNFMQNCVAMEKYIQDLDKVWQVARVRNSIMHNVLMKVDERTLAENFDRILDLLEDEKLRKATLNRDFPASEYIDSVRRLKAIKFDMKDSITNSYSFPNEMQLLEESSSSDLLPSNNTSTAVAVPQISQPSTEPFSENPKHDDRGTTGTRKRKQIDQEEMESQVSAKQQRRRN